MEPIYFESAQAFRDWLSQNHDSATELWVGYYKKGAGREGISYPESVDQALCFGWIDGIRKSVDDTSYKNRFTPRKARSNWSNFNIKRVEELTALGLMQPSGLKAFEQRDKAGNPEYSYEAETKEFDAAYEDQFKVNELAWKNFQAMPNHYRKGAIHWVMSAKQAETRQKRLNQLIEDSAAGRKIAPFTRPQKPG